MQPRPRRILLSLSLLALFCFAPEARADAVAVTSGWITFTFTSGQRNFRLEGDGLLISGGTSELLLPGLTPDVSRGGRAELGRPFLDDDLLLPRSPFTVGGVTYAQYQFASDFFIVRTTADTFDFPTDPSVTSVTFSSAFTMEGVLGIHPPLYPNGLRYDLTGQGIVTASYVRAPGFPVWALQNLSYTFQAPPTPTPEPATLLLLGSGLAGVAAKAYRRRRRD